MQGLEDAAALGALLRFSFDAVLDRASACLLPAALERFFIASTRAQKASHHIGSGQRRPWAGLGSATNVKNRRAIYPREFTRQARRIRGLRLNLLRFIGG